MAAHGLTNIQMLGKVIEDGRLESTVTEVADRWNGELLALDLASGARDRTTTLDTLATVIAKLDKKPAYRGSGPQARVAFATLAALNGDDIVGATTLRRSLGVVLSELAGADVRAKRSCIPTPQLCT